MNSSLSFINPYYKFGQLHNEGLDFVFSNLADDYYPKQILPQVDVKDIINLTSWYLSTVLCNCSNHIVNDKPLKTNAIVEGNYQEALIAGQLIQSFNEKSEIETLCKKANLSDNSIIHFNYIFNSSFDKSNPEAVERHFSQHEENIFKSSLSDTEKQYLLFTLSICSASATYIHGWDKGITLHANEPLTRGKILHTYVSQYDNTLDKSDPKKAWYERWNWKKDGKGGLKGLIGDVKDGSVDWVKGLIKPAAIVAASAAVTGGASLVGVVGGWLVGGLGSAIVDSAADAFNLDKKD